MNWENPIKWPQAVACFVVICALALIVQELGNFDFNVLHGGVIGIGGMLIMKRFWFNASP